MLLQVQNNLDSQSSTLYSYISINLATGGTIVPVKNINGFQSSWGIQLGKTGEEQSEVLNISGAIAGTALNTAGTVRYGHPQDTPVYQIHYDSVIFYRSTTGTTGNPSAIATVPITPDSYYTEYNDTSGAAIYAYQTQYYNSISGDLSGTSSWFIPGGPTFYSLQKLRARTKHDLYSANYIHNDEQTITDWINEWLELMTNSMIKVNQGYAIGTALYPFGPATGSPAMALGTVTDPLFKQPNKIEITTDGVTWINTIEIPLDRFSSQDFFSSQQPRHFWQGDIVFGILPPPSSVGTARFTNSIRYIPLINDTDEVPQIMKSYTTSCIEYCLYKAYSLDQKDQTADGHFQKFAGYQQAFISEITPRDQTGVKTIDFTDSLAGSDDDVTMNLDYFV